MNKQLISIEPIGREAAPLADLGNPKMVAQQFVQAMLDRFPKGDSYRVRWLGGRVPAGVDLGG